MNQNQKPLTRLMETNIFKNFSTISNQKIGHTFAGLLCTGDNVLYVCSLVTFGAEFVVSVLCNKVFVLLSTAHGSACLLSLSVVQDLHFVVIITIATVAMATTSAAETTQYLTLNAAVLCCCIVVV